MKFMMMMHAPRGTGDYNVATWRPEDVGAMVRYMHAFNAELKQAGEFVIAEGLAPPATARLVRGGSNGEPITDGPFAEAKEFLVGFWIVDVESEARAYELAAKASMAPGAGGGPSHTAIEVRPVGTAPKTDV